MRNLIFILIIITSVSILSCNKKSDDSTEPGGGGGIDDSSAILEAETDTEGDGTDPERQGTIQLETRNSGEVASEDEETDVLEIERDAGMEAFLAIRGESIFAPEDFVIGPLQIETTDDRDVAELLALIKDYFENLSRGLAGQEIFAEDMRDRLKESMEYYIGRGLVPERVRIGKISLGGNGSAHCNIRLYAGKGVSSGELYFVKEVNRWYISDIQADFTLLAEVYMPDSEPYEPGIYKYLETY